MEKYLSRNQVQTILDGAPKNVDKTKLIESFVSDGYTLEGLNDSQTIATTQKPAEPTSGVTNQGIQDAHGQTKAFIGGAGDILGGGLVNSAIQYGGEKLVNAFGTDQMKQNVANAPTLNEKYQNTFGANEHPTAYGAGEVVAGVGSLVPLGVEQGAKLLATTKGAQVAENVGKVINNVKEAGKTALNSLDNSLPVPTSAPSVSSVEEIISPKINQKEIANIFSDNRLVRGQESLLFGKSPDVVTQSDKVKNAAQTIQKIIPNANQLNDAQLHTALDSKVTELAQTLKPEMQSVQIDKTVTGKVRDEWKALKSAQSSASEFLDNQAGNTAFQKKFENYLGKLNWDIMDASGKFKTPTPKTLDDVWQTAKDYDASIPANVKTATTQSSPILQTRKEMWLQNRSLLRDAINDSVTGLGDTSKTAFSAMHDMYQAMENIVSKAKIDLNGAEGIVPNTIKGVAKKAALVGAGALGVKYLGN